jgi:hypothetical protein
MNDILETVQHKIDKIEERLPGVIHWEPDPAGWTSDYNGKCRYTLYCNAEDEEYREKLIWELTAELLYWYGMQKELEAL